MQNICGVSSSILHKDSAATTPQFLVVEFINMSLFLLFFLICRTSAVDFTWAHSTLVFFSPLFQTPHHRVEVSAEVTDKMDIIGGRMKGRGPCTPSPQRKMSYLVPCPPRHYLLHLDTKTVCSWSMSTVVEIRFQTFFTSQSIKFKLLSTTWDQKLNM